MDHREAGKRGYIYILINPAFAGFVKIGKTSKDPAVRARELSAGTGVPAPYAVAWDLLVSDCDHVERLIHHRGYAAARTRSRAGKASCRPWRMRRRLSCRQVHP